MKLRIFLLSLLFVGQYLALPVRAQTSDPQLSDGQITAVKNALSQATFANSPPTTTAATYVADLRVPQIPGSSGSSMLV